MYKTQPGGNATRDDTSLSRFAGYLISLFGASLILYILPLILVCIPQYANWSRVADSPILTFAFKAAGQNADVVIFGDSSANHGVDPSQMTKALGATVLDLPSNLSVLLVTGDLPLRYYLARDRPPKLIVLYLAAWDLDYRSLDVNSNPPYTGLEILFRYGSWPEIWRFTKGNASLVLRFPLMFYRANLNFAGIFHAGILRSEASQVAATNGHADSIGLSQLDSGCRIPDDLVARINFSTASNLASKLTTPYTKVLIYVAPIPECVNSSEVISRLERNGLGTAPKVMAPSMFVKDQYYTHLFAAAVPDSTKNLIENIRPLLSR